MTDTLLNDGRLARRVSISVIIRAAGLVVTLATGLASIVLLTRYLSLVDYGYYITATTVATFIAAIVDGGITGVAVRESAKHPERREALASAATAARLTLSIAAAAAGIVFVQFAYGGHERDGVRIGVLLTSAALPIGALAAGFQVVAESTVRVGRLVLGDTAARLGALALLILVVELHWGYAGAFTPAVAGAAVSTLFLASAYRQTSPLRLRVNRSALQLMAMAFPLGLALVLNALYFRVDAVLLSLLRSPHDVAIYGLAYRSLEVALSLGGFLLAAMLPVMSAATRDPSRWSALADRTFTFFTAVGLSVAGCGWAVAGGIASFLGGDKYAGSGRTLSILLLAAALSWVNGFGGLLLISISKQGQTLWLNVLALAANVLANVLVIPKYGYLGAAWVTVASELVNFAGMIFLVRRYAGYRFRVHRLGQVSLLTLVVVSLVTLLRLLDTPWVAILAGGSATWAVLAYRLNLISRDLWRLRREAVAT